MGGGGGGEGERGVTSRRVVGVKHNARNIISPLPLWPLAQWGEGEEGEE